MNRMPAAISARTVACRAGSRGGVPARISSRQTAETRKLPALNSSAAAYPTACAAIPAAPRPQMTDTDLLPCNFALPSIRSADVTRDGR